MQDQPDLIGAIDIGGTKIAIGLVSHKGQVVCRRTLRTTDFPDGRRAVVAMGEALCDCLSETGARIAGIGISCTGPVDPLTGIIGKVANLPPGWNGYPLVEQLSAALTTRVVMENDADSAALAEFQWGCGRGANRFLYVTISTGIGCGFIADGELYRGAGGSHPEMGHHVIDPTGPVCYCGARGCWESLASGIAIKDWFLQNDPAHRFSATPFTAETVFALYSARDPLAEQTMARLAHYVGLGLANMTTILVPDVIAIGGGIGMRGGAFLSRAEQVVRRTCGEVPNTRVAIQTALLEKNLDLAGGAAAWLRTVDRSSLSSHEDGSNK
jgi:glucokinase